MATKKKYNFKGLDEIFGESVSDLIGNLENPEDQKEIKELTQNIKLNLLKPNPFQPRKVFDSEGISELAESIKIHGIIQPIIVNKVGNNYQIVAGERRSKAAKVAGLDSVPVIVLDISEQQMEEFAIIENIQRVDLTDIEEAIAYKKLSSNLNLKQEEIAKRVGKSRSHIANIMRLLNLPDKVQEAMLNGEVSMGQAKPLLSILSNEKLLTQIFNQIIAKNLTAREVENLIKSANSKISENKVKGNDPNIKKVENWLMRRFGTKVTIDESKISIRYIGDEDLNRIIELLGLEDDD